MDKPLIVAVNGPAAGAGLGLALLGDIVLASSTATFTTAYTGIGLSPDGGVSWLLPRLIGLRAAQRMMILNQSVAADEALKIGQIGSASCRGRVCSVRLDLGGCRTIKKKKTLKN